MKSGFVISALLAVSFAASASETKDQQVIEISVQSDGEELNIAEITHDLITREMGETEFQKFVAKTNERFKDWSREFDNGNLKQFLDDRLIAMAPTVTSGKGEALRNFCQWLALYRVHSEPLPRYIREISDEDKLWIKTVLADFDWDGAALKIKENAKR